MQSPKLVVLVESYGNHSNRLWQNLWLEAFCVAEGFQFSNPSFHDLASLYGQRSPWSRRLLATLLKVGLKVGWIRPLAAREEGDAESYRQQVLKTPRRIVFVSGWGFRSQDLVAKYSAYFRDKYLPRLSREEEQLVDPLTGGASRVLGVHIRRRDYRTWEGGRYHFSNADYRRWIDQWLALDEAGVSRVVLFSDELVDTTAFESLRVPWIVSKFSFEVDYVVMSRCTHLVGPPSTFTMWASFLGNNLLCHVGNASQVLADTDFKRFPW